VRQVGFCYTDVIVELKIIKKIIFGMRQPAVYKILPDVSGQLTTSIFEEAVNFSKALVNLWQNTRRRIPAEANFYCHRR
jgi:hypothetical protein